MKFISSWDDGHPLDLRIADLLDRHDLAGTFFIPITNCEGREVMSASGIRYLDSRFEIGSHTHDHRYLSALSLDEMQVQIVSGKTCLEEVLGHEVGGFCYPGGKTRSGATACLRRVRIKYARITENLRMDVGHGSYRIPTTLQFFPHTALVLLRNWARYGQRLKKIELLSRAMHARDFMARLVSVTDCAAKADGVLHIWGHSWEIEEYGLWSQLDWFLGYVAGHGPECLRVQQIAELA